LRLNAYRNVTVVQAALAEADGTAAFYGFAADAFHHGISSLLPDAEATTRMDVPTLTGRTLVRQHRIDGCDFVKIDVEGAERIVLRELWPLIARHRPYLVFEYRKQHWAKFAAGIEDVVANLTGEGYELLAVRRDVIQPLVAGAMPDSCEVVAVPGGAATAG